MLLSSVKSTDAKRQHDNKQAIGLLHARSLAKHTVIMLRIRLVQTVQITFKDMQSSLLFGAAMGARRIFSRGGQISGLGLPSPSSP